MDTEHPPPIGLEEIRNIGDENLRGKVSDLLVYCQRHREASFRLQKGQIELEQEIFELQQQNESLGRKLHETSQVAQDLKEQLKTHESEKAERTRRLFELESLHDVDESQKAQLKRQCEQLLAEKNSLSEVIDNKNQDLETKKVEIQSLHEELRLAVSQKCEMQIKLGDFESRELAIEYKENRLKEERELLAQEKEWLHNELRERDQTIQQLRKENNKRFLEHQTAMASKDDELRETKTALETANTNIGRLTEQLESLTKKMKEAADERALKDESYEKELQCQIRLVQVYKQASEEAEARVEELATALDDVQQLFSDAKQQHFTAQEEIKQLRVDFENEMKAKDDAITELRDELDKANELLRSKHRVMLTDEEVAALSPAAAAASKLIKSGTTLTQIYREHLKLIEELDQQKLENKRIEGYFRELVQEIETKAPALRQQQEGYSRSLTVIENLKRQLAEAAKEQQTMTNEKDTVTRQLTYTKAELERYQRDNADLAAQVRQLLWLVERMRAGDQQVTPVSEMCQDPSADDLRLFRTIDELQSQHQRLLSALREAEARRDEMVKAAQEAEMSKIRAEMEGTMREVEQMRNQREKQNQLLESVRDERDTYKRLYHQAVEIQESATDKSATSAATEAPELQSALEKTRLEFDVYRKQKNETERILHDKLEKCENTIAELRSTNVKLNAEVEYQTERFKILSGNVDTYKKEINGLRERNEKSMAILAKHEQSITHLTDQLLSSTEEASRFRVENGRLQEQLQNARTNESMAQKELQLLRKNQHTQQMVALTLQELDARLKRHEAEDTLKLKTDLEARTRERDNLQATVKTMTEQSKDYVRDCKVKITALEAKVEEEQRQTGHLRSQLQWTEEQLQAANSRAQELKNELDKLQSTYQDASAGRFQKEAQQLQTRLNYLEIRYTESNKKIEELTEQLNAARNEILHYRRLADSLEGGLKEHKETSTVERTKYDSEMANYKSRIDQLTNENDGLKNEIVVLKQSVNELLRQSGEKEKTFTAQVETLRRELTESKRETEEWQKRENEVHADRDRLTEELKEFRDKFEHEFLAHGATKEELASAQEQLQTWMSQYNTMESQLTATMQEYEARIAAYEQNDADKEARVQALTERYEESQRQVDILLNETERLTNQAAMLERISSTRAEGEEAVSDLGAGMEQSSTSAIMEVVRCLRNEKQQLAEKSDHLDAEVRRLRSREQMMENDIASLKGELESALAEAAIAATATAEKTRLLGQLSTMQSVQVLNQDLKDQIGSLNQELDQMRQELYAAQETLTIQSTELEEAKVELNNLATQADSYKADMESWHQRYQELLEERSKFEPEEVSRLRKLADDRLEEISEYKRQLDESRSSVSQEVEALSAQNAALQSEINNLRVQSDEFRNTVEARDKTLQQVRQLALKYKTHSQENEDRNKALQAEIDSMKAERGKLEADKKELETRCTLLETRSRQMAVQGLDPNSDAAVQISELSSKLDEAEKKMEKMKASMSETGQKLVLVQAEKKQVEQQLAEVQNALEKAEELAEERKFRLESLVSMHSQCQNKIQDLSNQLVAQNEQYQADKAAWERQSQEGKVPSKPTPVQLVSAMPAGAVTQAERIAPTGGNHEQRTAPVRPSRQYPTVASVRPIASHRATAPVPPTAVSPGPSYPDQSSAVSSLPSVPVSISPTIISSSQQSNVNVPHAVVPPHIESGMGSVSGSMDASSDISSSVVFVAEPLGTSEASTSSEPEAPSVAPKRRPPQDPSDRTHKRPRASSPEQVSTSDQHVASGFAPLLPILPEEIVESGTGLQPVVGSSADDNSSDVIFVEEVDRGIEPESSGQDQPFDENRSAVANLGTSDAGPSRLFSRQQPSIIQSLMGHHSGGMPWDAGDDGIVPSTPTLISRRGDQDMGAAAHVPQPRFVWTQTIVQEPIPISHSLNIPAAETTAQRSVPSTPRVVTPPDMTEREPASSSNIVDVINLSGGDQQPQPSGQSAESELVEAVGIGGDEEPEGTSEAMAAKPESADDEANEDSNEPTTSQQPRGRVIRLRRPPETGSSAATSQPATSTVSGSLNTGRRGQPFGRARRGRGRKP